MVSITCHTRLKISSTIFEFEIFGISKSIMPSRKRTSQGEDAQQLPLREKRRRTKDTAEEDDDLENSLAHVKEPVAKRGPRSNHAADVSTRPDDHGSPEVSPKLSSKKKSHVRFGSEDPPSAPVVEDAPASDDGRAEDEDSDDDEAPEEVTQSNAEAQLKAELADQARLAKEKEQKERDRRRKRDEVNKAQVKTSEKRRRKAADEGEEDEAPKKSNNKKSKKSRAELEDLPNLLPEELLATEAPERGPTPPLTAFLKASIPTTATAVVKKAEKPPADVVHEGKRIRVLPSTNSALPPKVNKQSKNMKAQWMAGQTNLKATNSKRAKIPMVRRRAVGAVSFV